MPKKLIWDNVGERTYETGVKMGVLYPIDESGEYSKGVAWNGLTKVSESPSGAETTDLYANDSKYLSLLSAEKYAATISAYTFPDEFAECDGSAEITAGVRVGQQERKSFAFCYRTVLGNDVKGDSYGYKLHMVYGCKASPSSKEHTSVNESPEAVEMSWEINSTPISVEGVSKPVYTIEIDSTKVKKENLEALEKIIYGSDEADARLPLPAEVFEIMKNAVAAG